MAEVPQTPPAETPEAGKEILVRQTLRDSKLAVDYQAPIEIGLFQKELVIYSLEDFREKYGVGANADFVLVDPQRFDPEKFDTGYKGLRRGEPPVILGSGKKHQLRFPDLPPEVSKQHLRLEVLPDGKIEIADLRSKLGTDVRYTYKAPRPEIVSPRVESGKGPEEAARLVEELRRKSKPLGERMVEEGKEKAIEAAARFVQAAREQAPVWKEKAIDAAARFAVAVDGAIEDASQKAGPILERGRKVWEGALGKIREIKPREFFASLIDFEPGVYGMMAQKYAESLARLEGRMDEKVRNLNKKIEQNEGVYAARRKEKEEKDLARLDELREEFKRKRQSVDRRYRPELLAISGSARESKEAELKELRKQKSARAEEIKKKFIAFDTAEKAKRDEIAARLNEKFQEKEVKPYLEKSKRMQAAQEKWEGRERDVRESISASRETWALRLRRLRETSQRVKSLLGVKEVTT